MVSPVPSEELNERMTRFRIQMDTDNPEWELSAIFGNINLYYLTGTMQDSVLLIPRDEDATLWVRRSYDRAVTESRFPDIRKMESYREPAAIFEKTPELLHIETAVVPLAVLQRFQKYFPSSRVLSLDTQVGKVRAVKSGYELDLMKKAGKIHRHVLEDLVPSMLREGMSEAEFSRDIYSCMIDEGHHGIIRFGMFNTEILVGQVGFGESSIYPTSFDGPGGCYGMCPAVPTHGSRERTLRKGDLVFVDNGCGVEGYHTDKTQTYVFKGGLQDSAIAIHEKCVEIQNTMADMLRPGVLPSVIYESIVSGGPVDLPEHFMGYENRRASFLGHGTGLLVDEIPVIARGFDDPLQEGMVIALEPKAGVKGVGMVGIENTFLVTRAGGVSITGSDPGLMQI